jgi:3-isopropylmalate/(R)-2-methylmalate dehydratase small subunit
MSNLEIIRGKVWKFGDNISTTDIYPVEMFPSAYHGIEQIAFAAIRPDWKDMVKPGDCIVAGKNFGLGSQRDGARILMRDLKIGCIVADSFSRLYYRTMIAIGFPVFPCPGVSEIFDEGNELELDVHRGLVKNLTTGQSVQGKPYHPEFLKLLEAGGVMPLLVERVRRGQASLLR